MENEAIICSVDFPYRVLVKTLDYFVWGSLVVMCTDI